MRIIHRVTETSSAQISSELSAIGIKVADRGLVTFEIDEASPAWPKLASWMERRRPLDVVRTEFSASEIRAARWLELKPAWHHGYPQPDEESFGYLRATYDLGDFCRECGVGLRQKAPFQFRGEPRWGSRGLLQINWVFDEFFATPQVWESVFEQYGVGRRPVLDTSGKELSTVVQLVVDEAVPVVTDGLAGDSCPRCGRMKYLPVARGRFPALAAEPDRAMVRTRVYFGSGASAFRPVLVRSDLAATLLDARVRGATLRPVEAAGQPAG